MSFLDLHPFFMSNGSIFSAGVVIHHVLAIRVSSTKSHSHKGSNRSLVFDALSSLELILKHYRCNLQFMGVIYFKLLGPTNSFRLHILRMQTKRLYFIVHKYFDSDGRDHEVLQQDGVQDLTVLHSWNEFGPWNVMHDQMWDSLLSFLSSVLQQRPNLYVTYYTLSSGIYPSEVYYEFPKRSCTISFSCVVSDRSTHLAYHFIADCGDS